MHKSFGQKHALKFKLDFFFFLGGGGGGGGGGTGSFKLEHCAYINAVSPEEAAHIPKEKNVDEGDI